MPVPRFRVRTLMIAVGVVAFVLVLVIRFEPRGREAERNAGYERYWRWQSRQYAEAARATPDQKLRELCLFRARACGTLADWFGQIKENHRSVRLRPWLAVPKNPARPVFPPEPG
jgi:hypothetical protein